MKWYNNSTFDIYIEFDYDNTFDTSWYRNGANGLPKSIRNFYDIDPDFEPENLEKDFNYVGSFRQPPERTYYQKSKAQSKVNPDGFGYIDQTGLSYKN